MSRYVLALGALVLIGSGCSFGTSTDSTTDSSSLSEDPVLMDSATDEGVAYELWAPELVSEGEDFEVLVSLQNVDSEEHILDSIDIGLGYLAGVQVQGADPAYYDEFLVGDNTYTHTFTQAIPVGETLEVTFFVEALEAGFYDGAFDVCIDTGWECLFRNIEVTVE